ncbi:MAG TPA: class I SAM-dependent methyltransferase [Tepidisphaeraceae bacterium]|nr:class I SAM-dependent methyltransferase [Tepidisphaeraceae bacterium]
MPMTQQCIHKHYEGTWKNKSDRAATHSDMTYSSPVEDAIVYPLYRQMIADLKIKADGNVLDVGAGSGRWIRFFLEYFQPRKLVGADYTLASVELLRKWFPPDSALPSELEFHHADITDPQLNLGQKFDLINIANVLFHIPEQNLFVQAMTNLARHVSAGGMIVTTEYLPRTSMRTEWMLVRDRYTFEKVARDVGLRIVAVKAFSVFSNDPMGLDGPDAGTRGDFAKVRAMINALSASAKDQQSQQFITGFLAEIEQAVLSFCRERIAEIDMPSQKLVFLTPA